MVYYDYEDEVKNRPLTSITLSENKEKITFKFQDGTQRILGVEGDCCSTSWVEHMDIPDNLEDQRIVEIIENRSEEEISEAGWLRSYQTKFVTDKGNIISLEYRNESNGYYEGSLVVLE